jgi:hypothetical protein
MGDKGRTDSTVREHLARLLTWEDSHVGFDTAIAGIPPAFRGKTPNGAPYSLWQLLEHLRRAQHDILDFCKNPNYKELHWPDDYWPKSVAKDPKVDLTAKISHGQGQTYLREIILAADHAAYHIGEFVLVRRLLGIWK